MASAKGARYAAMWGTDQIQQGENRVLGEYDTGYNTALNYLGDAGKQYKPYADRYNAGSSLYSDALGLGGADGKTRAHQAFTGYNPGYDFAMDQGLQALTRKRAAGGMLNSGNADADAMQFGQGLANQNYGSWLSQLSGMDQRGLQTAGQMAGLDQSRAGLTTDYYNRRGQTIDQNIANIVGLGTAAFKAGDQAKTQNQANMLAGAQMGLNLLGSLAGGGGSSGKSGTGGMPGDMGGFMRLFAGT